MIRPKSGQVLVRVLPRRIETTLEVPSRFKSAEEVQEDNHNPRPPEPIMGEVLAIGAWPKLKNGLVKPPPFPAGCKILMRPGSGTDLSWQANERWKLVKSDDILAVLSED